MKYCNVLGMFAATAFGLSVAANGAWGQQQSLKDGLIGTWMVVSWEEKKSDDTTLRQFGTNPTGMAVFDGSGRYIITVMRSDRARYKSGALWQGTAEENQATANGTQTYFGTYLVNEADHSVSIHVEGSSFPNWNGTNQKRFIAITGDQLTLTIHPPSGQRVDVIWKRAK